MGWSIDLYRDDVATIFGALEKQFSLSHPDTGGNNARLQYEGEIPLATKKVIASMFPDFVYVEFVPNTVFTHEPAETH